MRHLNTRLLTGVSVVVTALCVCGQLSAASASSSVTQISRIKPATAPEYAPVKVAIKGTDFNTEPGETTVAIGGQPATSVECTSSKHCTAVTPLLPEGPATVTVTSNGMTSTNAVTFTSSTYDPPVVQIVPSKKTDQGEFTKSKLLDDYAAIFDFGNVYLNIENATNKAWELVGPNGAVDLGPEEVEGYNIPVSPSPYLFTLPHSTGSRLTLTVTTQMPA